MENCYTCKAKTVCSAAVQPGSIMCMMYRMRLGGHMRMKNHAGSLEGFVSTAASRCGKLEHNGFAIILPV